VEHKRRFLFIYFLKKMLFYIMMFLVGLHNSKLETFYWNEQKIVILKL